jgi:hypothetical protein
MKTSCSITLNFDPGNDITDAFEDAVTMANKLGCVIDFKFNDCTCIAYPNSDPKEGVDGYHFSISSKYPIAISHPKK